MIWTPGPRSSNLEDRRFVSEEEKLAMALNAARTGDIADPDIGLDLPDWMWPDDVNLQQAAVDQLATQRALERLSGAR